MKRRINERQLKAIVAESIKKILKENYNYNDSIKNEVENIVNEMGSSIEQWLTSNEFMDSHGFNGYIFDSEESAEQSILFGDNHQNAIDYVEGAQRDDEWIQYLINGGVNSNLAKKIITNQDWEKVVEIIVKTSGPEWFLSTYSGEVHPLSDGSILYY